MLTTASQRSANVPRIKLDPAFHVFHEVLARGSFVERAPRVLPGDPDSEHVIARGQTIEARPEAGYSRIAGADGEVELPVGMAVGPNWPDVVQPDFHGDHGTDELLRMSDLHHELGVGFPENVRLFVVRTAILGDVVPDLPVIMHEELGVARLAVGSHVGVVGPVGGRPRVDVGSTAAGEHGQGQNGHDGNEQCAFHRILLRLQLPLVAE